MDRSRILFRLPLDPAIQLAQCAQPGIPQAGKLLATFRIRRQLDDPTQVIVQPDPPPPIMNGLWLQP